MRAGCLLAFWRAPSCCAAGSVGARRHGILPTARRLDVGRVLPPPPLRLRRSRRSAWAENVDLDEGSCAQNVRAACSGCTRRGSCARRSSSSPWRGGAGLHARVNSLWRPHVHRELETLDTGRGAGVARLHSALGRSGPDLNEPFIRRPSRQRRLILKQNQCNSFKGEAFPPRSASWTLDTTREIPGTSR